ncbi:MAG: hypothetical protein JW821_18265 [Deltaproteobacteria bacterium]|nr:hypothetical protein [Deltaproteobacteria bacterium]
MKALKKELQGVVKNLKTLTQKTEKLVKDVGKIETSKTRAAPKAKRGRKPGVKKVVARAVPAKRGGATTAMDQVLAIVKRSKKGVTTTQIKNKTGFNDKKIWNAINRLKMQDMIKSERKGVYVTK